MAIGNKTDAQILELKEAQMKTDAQQNRTDVQLKETIKEFRAAQKLLGDMGLVQGEVADDKKTAPLQDFVAGVPGQQDTGRSWRAGGEG